MQNWLFLFLIFNKEIKTKYFAAQRQNGYGIHNNISVVNRKIATFQVKYLQVVRA